MGGVVSDVTDGLGNAISGVGSGLVNEIGKLGFQGGGGILGQVEKGITSTVNGVSDVLSDIDDAIPKEAKIAAALYLATQGLSTGSEGSLANLGATDASLGAAGAANA